MEIVQPTSPDNIQTNEKKITKLSQAILGLLQEENITDFDIAIDGDAGAGKDTLGVRLAKLLNILFVNSGDFYRAIAAYFEQDATALNQQERQHKIQTIIENHELELTPGYFNNKLRLVVKTAGREEDVTAKISQNAISRIVALFSQIHEVRSFVNTSIQKFASNHNIVMGGRDIGMVVLPNALFHVILTASPEVRAKRRFKELEAKKAAGDPKASTEVYTYESILEEIIARDGRDAQTVAEIKAKLPENHPHPIYEITVDTDGLDAEGVLVVVLEKMLSALRNDMLLRIL